MLESSLMILVNSLELLVISPLEYYFCAWLNRYLFWISVLNTRSL